MKNWALKYRKLLNWSVIPIVPDTKRPFVRWTEFQQRLATIEEINSWWGRWPEAQVGVVCGKVSDLVVVDFDLKNNCPLHYLQEIPAAYVAITKSKGYHYYYKYDPQIPHTLGQDIPIDIQSDASYVLTPPSIGYEWQSQGDLVPPPVEWIKRIQQNSGVKNPRRQSINSEASNIIKVPIGQRHRWLVQRAGVLRARGYSSSLIEAALKEDYELYCEQKPGEAINVQDHIRQMARSMENYTRTDVIIPEAAPDHEYLTLLQGPQVELIPTGYKNLDKEIMGWAKENVYVVMADTGVGKTSLVLNFIVHLLQQGASVMMLSTEMKPKDIYDRLACIFLERPFADFRLNKITIEDLQPFLGFLKNKRLILPDLFSPNKKDIEQLLSKHRPDVFILDHFQHVEHRDAANQADLVKTIKEYALSQKMVAIICSQFRKPFSAMDFRTGETVQAPRTLHDVKGASDLVHEASVCIYLSVDKGSENAEATKLMLLDIQKNRFGRKHVLGLNFIPWCYKFTGL